MTKIAHLPSYKDGDDTDINLPSLISIENVENGWIVVIEDDDGTHRYVFSATMTGIRDAQKLILAAMGISEE